MTRSADEQARRYLRAFPAWMRADRGEEVVGLVLDQLPAGADQLPLHSRWELVRAGLHARRRGTPPPSVWFEVLAADVKNRRGLVPEAWRPWLLHWVHDPTWYRRYVTSYVLVVGTLLLALGPIGAIVESPASLLVNVALWALVLGFVLRGRAPRWRWAVALRNGLVPSDLRELPAEATQRGFVRPMVADRPALPIAVVATAFGGILLGAIALITALVPAGERGPAHPTIGAAITLVEVTLVGMVLVRPVLRRVGRASVVPPEPPDPAAMVAPLRSGASLAGGIVLVSIAGLFVVWTLAFGGLRAAIVAGAFTFVAVLETAWILRRQRGLGRNLRMWEVWPVTGPRPLLLVRQDVMEAEGLRGPAARRSQWPGSPA